MVTYKELFHIQGELYRERNKLQDALIVNRKLILFVKDLMKNYDFSKKED